jgi:hypothetical protein
MRTALALSLCIPILAEAFHAPTFLRLPQTCITASRCFSTQTDNISSSELVSNKSITKPKKNPFDSFDYTAQWYPVVWAQDVPLNEPIRVTLFDVHYVICKTMQAKDGKDGEENDVSYLCLSIFEFSHSNKIHILRSNFSTGLI